MCVLLSPSNTQTRGGNKKGMLLHSGFGFLRICAVSEQVNLPGFHLAENRQGVGAASSEVQKGPAAPARSPKVPHLSARTAEKGEKENSCGLVAVQWGPVFGKVEVPPPQYSTGSILSHAAAKGLGRPLRELRDPGSPPGLWQGPPFYQARGGARSSCDGSPFKPVGRLQREMLHRHREFPAPALS